MMANMRYHIRSCSRDIPLGCSLIDALKKLFFEHFSAIKAFEKRSSWPKTFKTTFFYLFSRHQSHARPIDYSESS